MRDQNSKREAQRFRPLSAVGGIYNTTGELRKAGASSPSSLLSFAAWRSLEGGRRSPLDGAEFAAPLPSNAGRRSTAEAQRIRGS